MHEPGTLTILPGGKLVRRYNTEEEMWTVGYRVVLVIACAQPWRVYEGSNVLEPMYLVCAMDGLLLVHPMDLPAQTLA